MIRNYSIPIVIAAVMCLGMSPVASTVLAADRDTKSGNILSTSNMTGSSLKKIQRKLRSKGYRVRVDGKFGPSTSRAIIKYQRDHKLPESGFPDAIFRKHLFKR